jgi:flagellar protein FliL
MADTAETLTEVSGKPVEKKRFIPILVGILGALACGGGGFYAVQSGLILAPKTVASSAAPLPVDFAFVPIEQMTISVLPGANAKHLRFSAQIEVALTSLAEVERLRPRLLDMMNMYLRAVSPQDLADPAALVRLRAQLLRRTQMIVGEGHVRDILITEFVLS